MVSKNPAYFFMVEGLAIIGFIMHIFWPFTIFTMPPFFMQLVLVMPLVIAMLFVGMLLAEVAAEAKGIVTAASNIRMVFMPHGTPPGYSPGIAGASP